MTSEGQSVSNRRRAIPALSTLHGNVPCRDRGLDFGRICAFLPSACSLHIPDRPLVPGARCLVGATHPRLSQFQYPQMVHVIS